MSLSLVRGSRFLGWIALSAAFHFAVIFGLAKVAPVARSLSPLGPGVLSAALASYPSNVDPAGASGRIDVSLIVPVSLGPPPFVAMASDAGTPTALFQVPGGTLSLARDLVGPPLLVRPSSATAAQAMLAELSYSARSDFLVASTDWPAESILGHVAGELTGSYRRSGSLSVIFVIDSTASMLPRLAALRGAFEPALNRLFAARRNSDSLQVGVVTFAREPVLWCRPSPAADRVLDSLNHLSESARDSSGEERTMAAVRYAARLFDRYPARAKALVLITDERGDDAREIEEALSFCQHQGVVVHVIARETPLLSSQLMQKVRLPGQSTDAVGLVDVGLDTPRRELPPIAWADWRAEEPPSGFAPYALNRLAFATHGKLYLFDPQDGSKGYDVKVMRRYRPTFASLSEYERSERADPLQTGLSAALLAWQKDEPLSALPAAFSPDQLPLLARRLDAKIAQCDRLVGELEAVLPDDAALRTMPQRRAAAVGDLVRAHLLLARHRLHQLRVAVEAQASVRRRDGDVRCVLIPHAGKPADSPIGNRDRDAVIAAFKSITTRHAGTPWSELAADFLRRSGRELYAWRIDFVAAADLMTPTPAAGPSGLHPL